MKTIIVPFLAFASPQPEMHEVSKMLDHQGPGYTISKVNWPGFDNKPEVRFNIGYGPSEIYLKYYVREKYVKAEKGTPNENVYEDSCVEFFVAPEPDGIYYNFEFNAIGTCLMAKGTSRDDRQRMDSVLINKIRRFSSLGTEPFPERTGEQFWELTVAIPLEAFAGKEITDLKGKTFKANFYKCGDKLSHPHYLSWNPIGTKKPDFHRPEYFGTIKFE
ncbi:MAG: carbohydrate-binding family 9-like protein [Bacteroidota bacterium]